MSIDFNFFSDAFNNCLDIKNHKVIIRDGKTYKVAEKGSTEAKTKKIYLGHLLSSLSREVKKNERTSEDLKRALHISSYFVQKTRNVDSFFITKIRTIFRRCFNWFLGNGFRTNTEIAREIQQYLVVTKKVEIEDSSKIESFKLADFWESLSAYREDSLDPKFKTDPDFQILEKNFRKFADKVARTPQIDHTKPPESSLIPPTIHFIWMGSAVPEKINQIIDTWRQFHPGWSIKIWTDKEIESFPWKNRSAFEEARASRCWAEAADIWRYEILYNEGGIYSDTDVVCFKSFNDLIAHTSFFAGQETNKIYQGLNYGKPLYLCNAIVGAAKGSPVMKYCMDNLKSRSQSAFPSNPRNDILHRTGPILFSQACHESLQGPEKENVLVLPCSYVYPLPYFNDLRHKRMSRNEIRLNYVAPESLAVHLWDASW